MSQGVFRRRHHSGPSGPEAQVTQVFTEIVVKPVSFAQVTQTFTEVIAKPIAFAQVTQTFIEVIRQ